jgi:hypothetical protein
MASAFPSFTQSVRKPSDRPAFTRAAPRRLLGRFVDALIDARQREADEHVSRLLTRSGGRFTDALEREAERASVSKF